MDDERLLEEKLKITERIDIILYEKFPDGWFSASRLLDRTDESFYECKEMFRFLYSLGGDAHIYLWNHMMPVMGRYNPDLISREDFSNEEWDFITRVRQQSLDNISKMGEFYSSDININTFDSKRLVLYPWDSDLNDQYISFFKNNHDEYKSFYTVDYSDFSAENYISQTNRPLGFALIEKESKNLIGSVAFKLIRSDVVYNLEYFIFPEYRGKGFAYEAISFLIEKAKAQELKLLKETVREGVYDEVPAVVKCIEAKTAADNIASIRLAEKLGFKKTGDIPFFKNHHGTYSDGVAYDYII